jgi:hypothetical protein
LLLSGKTSDQAKISRGFMISGIDSSQSLSSLFFESRYGKTTPAAARESSGDTVSISEEARKRQEELAAAQAELAASATDSEPAVGGPETERQPTREDLLCTLPLSVIPDDLMMAPVLDAELFAKLEEFRLSFERGEITRKEFNQGWSDLVSGKSSSPRDRTYWEGDPEVRGYVDAIYSLSAQVIADMFGSRDESKPFSQEEFNAMRGEVIRRMKADSRTSGLMSELGIKEA